MFSNTRHEHFNLSAKVLSSKHFANKLLVILLCSDKHTNRTSVCISKSGHKTITKQLSSPKLANSWYFTFLVHSVWPLLLLVQLVSHCSSLYRSLPSLFFAGKTSVLFPAYNKRTLRLKSKLRTVTTVAYQFTT